MWNANFGRHYLREWGINKLLKMGGGEEGDSYVAVARLRVKSALIVWLLARAEPIHQNQELLTTIPERKLIHLSMKTLNEEKIVILYESESSHP